MINVEPKFNGPWGRGLEPEKEVFFNAITEDGREVVVKCSRQGIAESPYEIIYGKIKYWVVELLIQEEIIIKQVNAEFKKLGPVGGESDIELFLAGFRNIFEEEKKFILTNLNCHLGEMIEKEKVFLADEQHNAFWCKPNDFFLNALEYLCNTFKNPARDFFLKFIRENTKDPDGVLMLKAVFDFSIERC